MGVPFLGFRVAYIPNLSLLQSLETFEKELGIGLRVRVRVMIVTLLYSKSSALS